MATGGDFCLAIDKEFERHRAHLEHVSRRSAGHAFQIVRYRVEGIAPLESPVGARQLLAQRAELLAIVRLSDATPGVGLREALDRGAESLRSCYLARAYGDRVGKGMEPANASTTIASCGPPSTTASRQQPGVGSSSSEPYHTALAQSGGRGNGMRGFCTRGASKRTGAPCASRRSARIRNAAAGSARRSQATLFLSPATTRFGPRRATSPPTRPTGATSRVTRQTPPLKPGSSVVLGEAVVPVKGSVQADRATATSSTSRHAPTRRVVLDIAREDAPGSRTCGGVPQHGAQSSTSGRGEGQASDRQTGANAPHARTSTIPDFESTAHTSNGCLPPVERSHVQRATTNKRGEIRGRGARPSRWRAALPRRRRASCPAPLAHRGLHEVEALARRPERHLGDVVGGVELSTEPHGAADEVLRAGPGTKSAGPS